MIYFVTIGEKRFEVTIDGEIAKINGREVDYDLRKLRDGKIHALITDGKIYEFAVERVNGGFDLWYSSGQLHADISDEKLERLRQLTGDKDGSHKISVLKAPMPGLVLKIEVEPGQHVKKGDGLVIVEAMKMENELKAHAPGVVKEIKVTPRQPVEKNQVLIVFESDQGR
jgi:acetyl/propionyl-CoA carboxylase alpha subunit